MERCKVTVDKVLKRKGGAKICALTAYTYSMARLADRAGVDILLVGDSLAMVELGLPNTLGVGMEEMLHHTRAVARAEPKALLAVDMPFMSYGVSREETVRNAGRLIKEGGAEAVKLEGGRRVRDEIASLVDREIPVMGHVGLTPQSIHRMGGYKVQGKGEKGAEEVLRDALAVQEAGAFSVVLESIPAALAERITAELRVPTIGIGAGAGCDGQVLVVHDMLGLYEKGNFRFVKVYARLGELAEEAIKEYVKEVQEGVFPSPEHSF